MLEIEDFAQSIILRQTRSEEGTPQRYRGAKHLHRQQSRSRNA
jgi:hypothetical protein